MACSVDADVLIVGGGPVGLGLAIELGQRGVSCILSERYLQPQPIPKGQNLTQRTMEHLHFWGAEKELRSARTIPQEYGIGGLTTYGTLLGKYSYNWLQRELVKPYYFCANERLPQYATEKVLRHRVTQLPSVQTLFGWDAEAKTLTALPSRCPSARASSDARSGPHLRWVAMAVVPKCANKPASRKH
jgi:2-polyprenyl-6-methoxyphenol hydroxylase-like FAD-dependent oxidoreductase